MKKLHIRGEILLTMTALLWGASYVAQHVGMNYRPLYFHFFKVLDWCVIFGSSDFHK